MSLYRIERRENPFNRRYPLFVVVACNGAMIPVRDVAIFGSLGSAKSHMDTIKVSAEVTR